MYEPDLALNNQQWLICHKTKSNKTKFELLPSYSVVLSKLVNLLRRLVASSRSWC